MAHSNRERVGKGLELLAAGLRPFVERELKARLGASWESTGRESPAQKVNWDDPQTLLGAMLDHWNSIFRDSLGQAERSLVNELKVVRNQWAHHEQFSSNDAVRALDSIERLLNAVSAGDNATEVGQMRMDLMRVIFDEQRRSEMRKKSYQPTEGKPQGGSSPGGRWSPRTRTSPPAAIRRLNSPPTSGRSTRARDRTNTSTPPSSIAAPSSPRAWGGSLSRPCSA